MSDNIFDDVGIGAIKWEHSLVGTKGEFWSSGGQVDYILTSAKLALEEFESSEKLTRQLFPVREILDFKKMDFDQLLQRDLDDHRVATELIPYLLQKGHQGISFFPPIVAAILPFRKTEPLKSFESEVQEDIEKFDGANWKGVRSGKAYKFQELVTASGAKPPFQMARLSWNEGGARLVVLDGQHRAMAMLAIARTITDTWKESGEKYKYFYESRVKSIIDKLGGVEWLEKNISKIEFPVCILKFKNDASNIDQHDSARKLFVDVNQNARRPSESRIILLSDNDLLNIFTRATLNDIRKDSCEFPIFAVEYDYPGTSKKNHSSKPVKWSAIINIEMLRAAVLRTIFGPLRQIEDLDKRFTSKPNWSEKNSFMRSSLALDEWYPLTVEYEGETFDRGRIKRDYFPKSHLDTFIQKYRESWGESIILTLSNFLPFVSHGKALTELLETWSTIEVHSSLAKEAISQGQGMYWTLKDSFEHWKDKEKLSGSEDDTSRAWQAIEAKKKDFDRLLSKHYLCSDSDANIKLTLHFYEIFNTYASFVGLFLSFASITNAHKITGKSIPGFTRNLISCLNASLEHNKGKLKLFLLRENDDAINFIKGMDTPDSVYFRYFWLELLYFSRNTESNHEFDLDIVKGLVDKARSGYLGYLFKQQLSAMKSEVTSSEWKKSKDKIETTALTQSKEKLCRGLKKWFGYKKDDIEQWFDSYIVKDVDYDSDVEESPDPSFDEGL